ncbi:MAG: SAM-dependent methyltransferase [Candidatus Daviesbacteria bacterium]|nr:SAM-dependent methyltransferase [Candidatus Daviesbacteria bacterium]
MSSLDLIIFSLFFFPFCALALSWLAGTDAPYVPTKMKNINKVLKFARVRKGKKFYELGSGDGRVVYEAASMGADAVGIEQSILRVWYSALKARNLNLPNTKFIHGNVFNKNYSDANIIYIYLLTKGVKKLEEKLTKELKKKTIIITQTYHFQKLKPYKKIGDFNFYRI